MKYRMLGRTGFEVSDIAHGLWGMSGWSGSNDQESLAAMQLAVGQVDSRLLLAIAALETDEPIDIVRFGNIGPGGDADMPLRVAYLAESDQAAHMTSSAYVRSIVSDLGEAPAPANSASTGRVALPDGQTVLSIGFTAPSPLGLLGPQGSH